MWRFGIDAAAVCCVIVVVFGFVCWCLGLWFSVVWLCLLFGFEWVVVCVCGGIVLFVVGWVFNSVGHCVTFVLVYGGCYLLFGWGGC